MGPAKLDPELMSELQTACFEAIRADATGPGMARKLERDCIAVLHRHGHAQAQVQATSNTVTTVVNILLPKPNRTVQQVRIKVQ